MIARARVITHKNRTLTMRVNVTTAKVCSAVAKTSTAMREIEVAARALTAKRTDIEMKETLITIKTVTIVVARKTNALRGGQHPRSEVVMNVKGLTKTSVVIVKTTATRLREARMPTRSISNKAVIGVMRRGKTKGGKIHASPTSKSKVISI